MTELLSARSGGTFTTRTMSSSGHTYDRTLSVLSDDSDFEYLDIPETPDPFDESWYSFHKSISGPDGEELFSETEGTCRPHIDHTINLYLKSIVNLNITLH